MAKSWLGDFNWALPAVGLIGTWLTFGLCIVLFLAGAQRIPTELYEAARVDGAGFVREFFAVTLPGLRNEIVVAATLTTITALRNFDIIYNTTAGGPGGETEVPSWVMFHNAFDLNRVGYAASIAVVLTVIITAIALCIGSLSRRSP
jgi:raffinose/stachyose/melibiose transport system permease protein